MGLRFTEAWNAALVDTAGFEVVFMTFELYCVGKQCSVRTEKHCKGQAEGTKQRSFQQISMQHNIGLITLPIYPLIAVILFLA